MSRANFIAWALIGLKAAIREVLPGVWRQRCYVHFPRNALHYLPRKSDDDCL